MVIDSVVGKKIWIGKARLSSFGLLMILTASSLFLLVSADPARSADPFTVNSTGDEKDLDFPDGTFDGSSDGVCDVDAAAGNQCTLRAAIQQANATSGADTINFGISGSGVKTITPNPALPPITDQVTIDGYTQMGASENTLTGDGTNAVLMIEIDGTSAGMFAHGLTVQGSNASNSVIRGLAINRFGWSGIYITGDGAGVRIEGNSLGTDPSGTVDEGNGSSGVTIEHTTSGHTVGGTAPEARNLISGNGPFSATDTTSGPGILQQWSTGNRIEGNLIGTEANGTEALGNNGGGVRVWNTSNAVLGNNTIAFNGVYGVEVSGGGSTGNRILSNSIHSNGALGIDLNGDGVVTPNDKKDPDTGNNNLQNYPVITSAVTDLSTGDTRIRGKLNSTRGKKFTVQIFSSSQADPSGFGEGETFLGAKTVKTNRKGKASFAFTVGLPPGQNIITATATRKSTGDTSEFSKSVAVD